MKKKKKNLLMKHIKKYLFTYLGLTVLAIFGVIFLIHNFYLPKENEKQETGNRATESIEPAKSTETGTISQEKVVNNIKIPILMYHHIRDYNDRSDQIGVNLSVPPAKFVSQLDYIKKQGYETITFNDIKNNNIPEKPIILTFDDGYQNFYDNAFPELEKRKMTAVSSIIVNFIGKGDYMTGKEIGEVENNGIEIGSHTLSHPDLSKISVNKAHSEIFDSKKALEDIIGKPVISFCYPSGKYNDSVIENVKSAGYSYAVTTNGGTADFNKPYELSRHRMNRDSNIKSYLP